MSNEAPEEEQSEAEDAKGAVELDPTEDTASSRIRDAARKLFPQLVASGRDPANKKIYAPIVVELSKKEGVARTTGQKAWNSVLKEMGSGQPTQKGDAPSVSKTVGGVHAEVVGGPKTVTLETAAEPMKVIGQVSSAYAPVCPKCNETLLLVNGQVPPFCHKCGHEIAKEKGVVLSEEELDEALTDTIEFPTKMLYKFAEKAWDVKIEDAPDENDFKRLGKKWGDVVRAYGVDIPKFALLLIAGSTTAATIALPVLLARGDYIEREKAKAEAAKQGKPATTLPALETIPNDEKNSGVS